MSLIKILIIITITMEKRLHSSSPSIHCLVDNISTVILGWIGGDAPTTGIGNLFVQHFCRVGKSKNLRNLQRARMRPVACGETTTGQQLHLYIPTESARQLLRQARRVRERVTNAATKKKKGKKKLFNIHAIVKGKNKFPRNTGTYGVSMVEE